MNDTVIGLLAFAGESLEATLPEPELTAEMIDAILIELNYEILMLELDPATATRH